MNYRRLYKEHYGINFGKEYDIHHIDFNHNNNDIKNLLLIPKELHQRYHKCVNNLGGIAITKGSFTINAYINLSGCNYINEMKDFCEVMLEIQKFVEMKVMADLKIQNKGV